MKRSLSVVFVAVSIMILIMIISGCFLFKPSPPNNLVVTAMSQTSIKLSWSDSGKFIVYRGNTSNGNFNQRGQTNLNEYIDKNLNPSTTYFYEVKSKNNFGLSDPSNIASATTVDLPPSAPILKVSSTSTNTITFSWTENSTRVNGFKLYRSQLLTDTYTQIATSSKNATSYTDAGLKSESVYYYKIRSFNSGGDSEDSNVVIATTKSNLYAVSGYVKDSSGNGISNVIMSFSGGYSSITTGSNGHWAKDGLSGSVEITPSKSGWAFNPPHITVIEANNNVSFIGNQNVGTLKWKYKTGAYVDSSPAIGSDGTIYVGSYDGYLYAIFGNSGGLANTPWPMFHHDLQHTGRK